MNSENYPSYYRPYIDKVPENKDSLELLELSLKETLATLAMVAEDKASESYEEGKWSIKDIIQHIIDTERIFCFRALSFARGESKSLNGYDHDSYAKTANANRRTLKSLLEEFKNLRTSTIDLFSSFSEEENKKVGNANELTITVKQLQYIIVGHELHHRAIIESRYL